MRAQLHPEQMIPLLLLRGCENREMAGRFDRLRTNEAKAALIVLLVVTLAVFTFMVPPHQEVLHNILHHLNILPFLLAGLFFGWKGAVRTILLAVVLQSPSIYRHWFRAPLDAQDQLVELSCFGFAGVIAGVLSDRERIQRMRVETTKAELEAVYTELRENIDQLRKAERLSAAGQLSASLAHEIRNPLASISGAAGILARGHASAESRAECLDILTRESQRLNKLLTNFLVFARPRLPRLQQSSAAEIVQSVKVLAQYAAQRHDVHLAVIEPSRAGDLECDAEQIKQLLLNLILNAIDVSPEGATVEIISEFQHDRFAVSVRDRGPGVPAEQREHIFEPFFTTRENGTGLGLAISANIAAQHGGQIRCETNGAQGSVFTMELPLRQASSGQRVKGTA